MNHILVNCDTDSIMVAKPDQSPFSEEERTKLLSELNSLFPAKINWTDDGYFSRSIIFRTKNYVLQTPEGKIKTKGSAVKAPAKEVAIKEFIQETIKCLLEDD